MASDAPYLAICSQAPGQQTRAREALDAILAVAAFGARMEVLFCGAGVLQLVKNQGDYTGSGKPLDKNLSALPLYDIEQVYADAQSLKDYGLETTDLLPFVQPVQDEQAAALLRKCRSILSF